MLAKRSAIDFQGQLIFLSILAELRTSPNIKWALLHFIFTEDLQVFTAKNLLQVLLDLLRQTFDLLLTSTENYLVIVNF
jgi:hypothetical protein